MSEELDRLRTLSTQDDEAQAGDQRSRSTVHSSSPPGGPVIRMQEADRARPRRLVPVLLGAVTLAVIVGLALWPSGGPGSSHPAVRSAGSPTVSLSAQAVNSMLAPVTPEDYAGGTHKLLNFDSRAELAIVTKCLADHGYPDVLKSDPLPDHGQLALFEDPAALRVDGFGIIKDSITAPNPVDAAPGTSGAPEDVNSACAATSAQALTPLRNIEALYYNWYQQLRDEEVSNALAGAWSDWSSCMASRGLKVADLLDFESYTVKDAMRAPGADLSTELALATPFADCLEQTVIPARIALRTPEQATYINAHAAEFETARTDLPKVIDDLGSSTGVGFQQ